jgi:predicted nucleic acid-binding protein
VAWRIVLDSMVWVQAGATIQGRRGPAAEILGLALSQQVVVVASSYIRAEVLGVLSEEPYYRRRLASAFDPEAWLDESLAACAELVDVTGPPVLQAHAKDDPILWLAAAGGASHLVTWEERLLDLKHYRFTQVVTPPAFLRAWRDPAAHEPTPEWQVLRRGPTLRPRRARRAAAAPAGAQV